MCLTPTRPALRRCAEYASPLALLLPSPGSSPQYAASKAVPIKHQAHKTHSTHCSAGQRPFQRLMQGLAVVLLVAVPHVAAAAERLGCHSAAPPPGDVCQVIKRSMFKLSSNLSQGASQHGSSCRAKSSSWQRTHKQCW